ncbi:MAG: PQQ-dependent catabolism-associated beta-propeller protein [Thermodesulfobacteriota bacterium]
MTFTARRTPPSLAFLVACATAVAAGATRACAHGDEPVAASHAWRAWTWDAWTVALLMSSALLYARGLRALWRESGVGHSVRRWEAASFAVGWSVLALALVSPLHAIGEELFSVHMVQHEVLMLVSAPLLALSRPLLALLLGMPLRWRRALGQGARRPGVQRAWRTITNPLVAWSLHAIALWIWHVPALFQATLHSDLLHALQHASFLLSALLFWWAVIHGGAGVVGYGAAVLYVFTTSVHSGLLGALLTFASTPWYPEYARTAPAWGLTPLDDQRLGGLVMWIPAAVVYLVAALALFAGWLRQAELARTTAAATLALLAVASTAVATGAAPLAYVSNERDGTITVIDTASDAVVRTIPVGGRPRGIRTSPDGKAVYVALSNPWHRVDPAWQDRIVAIDVATGEVVRRLAVGTDPEQFAISRDGRRLYTSNEDVGTASVTDVATGAVIATSIVGIEPEGVTISPDGRWVYVTAETSNTVSVIDTEKDEVVASFLVGARPRDTAFSPDGKRAYVTAEVGGDVSVVDVTTHAVVDTIDLPPGALPVGVLVAPDDSRVYVATGRGDTVVVLDVPQHTIRKAIPVGRRVWGLGLTPDGSKLYAANGLSNDVSAIDTASETVVGRIAAGDGPWGIAMVPR